MSSVASPKPDSDFWTRHRRTRFRKAVADGLAAPAIAELFGVTVESVEGQAEREATRVAAFRWTDTEKAELRRLAAKGRTLATIARLMKRSLSAVSSQMDVLGIRPPASLSRDKAEAEAIREASRELGRRCEAYWTDRSFKVPNVFRTPDAANDARPIVAAA